ncbi:MAG: translation initiation factor-related protein YciH [Pseudomonadota bacterium]|jgi:translation initiation factor 1
MSKQSDPNYREVYSTERGTICPGCGKAARRCSCDADRRAASLGDGNVKVRRETKGRGGKTVTSVSGLALNTDEIKALLSELKRRLGGGGAVKDGVIELQGDHCESVIEELGKRGIKAKRAGG